MTQTTPRYGLTRLRGGESFFTSDYAYTDADRVLIDLLLGVGAELHHHTGVAAGANNVSTAPTLALVTTSGTLPAGRRIYYKVSLVDPNGLETAASPEGYVDTPNPLTEPALPSLSLETGSGLAPGTYFYALSAYYPTETQETMAPNSVFVDVPSGYVVRLTYPTLPVGAAGWNVYRRSPNESDFFHLSAVAGGPSSFVDNGALPEKCDRRRARTNLSDSTNSVDVTLPVALPATGWTWKIYRAIGNSGYASGLLYRVVEETSPGSGVILTTHRDAGGGTFAGQPRNSSQLIGSPSKVALANAAEVSGRLPLGALQGVPTVVTFVFLGALSTTAGTNTWVCEFPRATVIGARAVLGRGYHPASQSVIVDVNKGTGLNPSPTTIFTNQSTRPIITVGNQMGSRVAPQITSLSEGDSLTVDIDQTGGGATPTDRDLTVSVTLLVQHDRLTSDNGWS